MTYLLYVAAALLLLAAFVWYSRARQRVADPAVCEALGMPLFCERCGLSPGCNLSRPCIGVLRREFWSAVAWFFGSVANSALAFMCGSIGLAQSRHLAQHALAGDVIDATAPRLFVRWPYKALRWGLQAMVVMGSETDDPAVYDLEQGRTATALYVEQWLAAYEAQPWCRP